MVHAPDELRVLRAKPKQLPAHPWFGVPPKMAHQLIARRERLDEVRWSQEPARRPLRAEGLLEMAHDLDIGPAGLRQCGEQACGVVGADSAALVPLFGEQPVPQGS
jgi:hypothetical protein